MAQTFFWFLHFPLDFGAGKPYHIRRFREEWLSG